MKVYFRNRRLERAYTQPGFAEREWGAGVGRRYVMRVSQILSAETVSDLFSLAGMHFHPLTGDRAGQYGITLLGLVRMVVEVDESEPSMLVIEVVDYH